MNELKLFANISYDEIEMLIKCINAKRVNFKKDDFIIEADTATDEFGILLEGSARSVKWDVSGKQTIITMVEPGGAIGVLLAAMCGGVSPLAVQATSDSVVMMIPYKRILEGCEKNCRCHEKLLQNLVGIIAEKGLELHERINCLLEPSVRDKILTYLLKISREQKSRTFILPINRNIMAEYLNIERSSLSRELSRMKKDGLIEYKNNNFELKR
ncbi:MAG: Crp/Fnr family transcriptional regulator [Clostridiales bacterium]|jgi:CRP-like cAMP-binding protein|nr:Crp/Fnr family transcriptional regulator [Clostridiales bacterium]